jgi:hypothetical protein
LQDERRSSVEIPVESGSASLPGQIETRSQQGNDEGWAHELDDLRAYLEAA